MTPEEEILEKIKFVLSVNNDAQAIRIIEQYGFYKQGGYSQPKEVCDACNGTSHSKQHNRRCNGCGGEFTAETKAEKFVIDFMKAFDENGLAAPEDIMYLRAYQELKTLQELT